MKKKQVIQFIILFAIGGLLVWLSLRSVAEKKDEILKSFQQADYKWVILALLVASISHFLRAYRWNYLLKPLGYKTNLINANCAVLIGYLANYGIPRSGEVTRCTISAKYDKVPFEIGFGTVITERIVDMLVFLLISVFTMLFQFRELGGLVNELIVSKVSGKWQTLQQRPVLFYGLIIGVIILFLAFVFLRKKMASVLKGKFGKFLGRLGEGIGSIRKLEHPGRFIVLSLLIWTCYFYALYFCFFAISGTSGLSHGACLTLTMFGTFGVIFSPGGLGAYPLILTGILTQTYGVDEVSAFALPWLSWTAQFLLIVLLGLIAFIVLPVYNRKSDVISSTPAP
ncbi:MAG: lysylphosphatidylglycerol synthase transmembrane domain-containing protein [Sediminibacterium sp.]|nr:lysylphosphatidylglycerol synthase transmembrane domain-containing protein [Sediminibacterium sp.]